MDSRGQSSSGAGSHRGPVIAAPRSVWGPLWCVLGVLLPLGRAYAQQPVGGSIRGVVLDKDFDTPLVAAQVLAVETGQRVTTSEEGQYVFPQIPAGRYTLVFSKDGYARQVKADVVVTSGQLTDLDVALSGEFTEMDEFVVQDVLGFAAGSEAALLSLRFESPTLLDSIGADLMSRAGASDAASALKLVSGASVQDGKYAVLRGLPDRYVSSQVNGVRVPSADEDKRAVELDQFPAPVIESIQVSKTFTPDQQGDASGGAVDVRLKGVPDETTIQFRGQTSINSQVSGRDDFLTYDGGGVNTWGRDHSRSQQFADFVDSAPGQIDDWTGATGTTTTDAPTDYKWSINGGGKLQVSDDVRIGGFASFFYERDSSFYDDGRDDSYWVVNRGGPLTPETNQGAPSGSHPEDAEFKTALFDITQSKQSVQWGALGTFGIESDNHSVGLTYLYTRTAEDTTTLAEDTRGKEYYFPGYEVRDPNSPGNQFRETAPYIRLETLDYTERSTGTVQLYGSHLIPMGKFAIGDAFAFDEPRFDWSLSQSFADVVQPDKRQFGATWRAAAGPGSPAYWQAYQPSENINFGNFQRIFKSIEEDSNQASFDLKFPFQQWDERPGYLKFGIFDDHVDRKFDQDTFTNSGDPNFIYFGGWNDPWSDVFESQVHDIDPSDFDVDYTGEIDIFAWYGMFDLPVASTVNLIGGARFESTHIGIVNDPEGSAIWYPPVPPGQTSPPTELEPGDADVDIQQDDVLPAISVKYQPAEELTFRAAYSQTIARQTFKELTPIQQQEYLGGPVFIGNPALEISDLANYDLRVDFTPYQGGLVSASVFSKDVTRPIEYVQQTTTFTYTTPVNYPKGQLSGIELEARQDLGRWSDSLSGFAVGANGTLIDSRVDLPADEILSFQQNVGLDITSRDMTNAPEYLLNAFVTYDIESTGTQLALFYTVQGDTLVAGAGTANLAYFVPDIYAKSYDTLNLSFSQKLGEYFKLSFAVKNLTNPEIQEVYRSDFTGPDVTKTSYTKGIEYSIGLGASFSF